MQKRKLFFSVEKVTGTSLGGMLLKSSEDAINFITPAAPGSLNPGHGITKRPLILYGRGKEADALADAELSTFSAMTNQPAESNSSLIHSEFSICKYIHYSYDSDIHSQKV